MALIVKKELETGLVLEKAYCKIEEINANKEKNELSFKCLFK